jgi:hypothetical protein
MTQTAQRGLSTSSWTRSLVVFCKTRYILRAVVVSPLQVGVPENYPYHPHSKKKTGSVPASPLDSESPSESTEEE